MVLLVCNAHGTHTTPLVTGKSENPCCFKNVRMLPTKHAANQTARVTDIFSDYLRAVHAKTSSQNRKILLFIDQCVVHPQDTSYLTNVKVAFSFLKLHHHSLTTWPWNNQFIQTLSQQATFKRNYCCDWLQVASRCSTQDGKYSGCTAFNEESWCW